MCLNDSGYITENQIKFFSIEIVNDTIINKSIRKETRCGK